MIKRRTLIAAGLAMSATWLGWYRGYRYPVLSVESENLNTNFEQAAFGLEFTDCFKTASNGLVIRAFAPEPLIKIHSRADQQLMLELNNVSPEAELVSTSAVVDERISGITRRLTLNLKTSQNVELQWTVPFKDNYSFASIGDTGGGQELAWCIQRAADLGAKFLLHLGDFYYEPGDYESAINHFYNAAIPCYITIGNHDFHDGGVLHHQFSDYLGPFNNSFILGNTRFLNLDTAANFLPRSGGKRGRLVSQLLAETSQPHTVAFSHRPLHDPTGVSTHDIGHEGERDWIITALKQLNAPTLLSGHIHIFDRSEFAGIDNIIVGQGLGHQDLLTNDIGYSKLAIGTASAAGLVDYHFEPLNMPMEMHCHPRVEPVKASLRNSEHAELIKRVDTACTKKT